MALPDLIHSLQMRLAMRSAAFSLRSRFSSANSLSSRLLPRCRRGSFGRPVAGRRFDAGRQRRQAPERTSGTVRNSEKSSAWPGILAPDAERQTEFRVKARGKNLQASGQAQPWRAL